MEVICQECKKVLKSTAKGEDLSVYAISREIYNPTIGSIASSINIKLKEESDITESLKEGESRLSNYRDCDLAESYNFCQACYYKLLLTFESATHLLEKERDIYMENLQKVQQEKSKIDAEKDENQEKVLTTKKEELESELAALIEEEKILDEETKQLEEEEAAITVKEQEYWEKENEYEYKLKNHLESNAQMKNQWKSHFSGLTKHYDYLK